MARIDAAFGDHPLRTPFMVSRKHHACYALCHGPHRRRARGPPLAHPLWCRQKPAPALPWTA
eukprot:3049901-Pyramimonas_sp.AAC.1